MGRRRREQAALEILARRVWGDEYYEQHARSARSRRFRGDRDARGPGLRRPGFRGLSRVRAAVGLGVGIPMVLTAAVLSVFATTASAHTSTISISCSGVEFVYRDFPTATSATAHEVVSIDRVDVAVRDFTFVGPDASDTIAISVGHGTHWVEANVTWTFDGRTQGSDSDRQKLSYCSSTSTTVPPDTTSTSSPYETSTTRPRATTSTTVPESTTSSSPETSTTVPTTPSTAGSTTTSTIVVTTTTAPHHSTTTTERATTSTSSPVHPLGSTTTSSPVRPNGSTVPTGPTSTAGPPRGNLPFTGSGRSSLVGGLFAVGVGLLALGLTSLRKARAVSDE